MLCGVEDVAVFLIFRKQCVIVSIGFNGDADTLRRGFYAGALPGGGSNLVAQPVRESLQEKILKLQKLCVDKE